jgi:ATP-dependent DNA helicase RecG
MPSSPLQQILASGESEQVAFVGAATELALIGKLVCAFLNSRGGTLVAGVDERGVALGGDASGVQKIQQHLLDKISPKAFWSVSLEDVGGSLAIAVEVPQGTEPPYVYADKIYVRRDSVVKAASGGEITALIEKRHTQSIRWERMPALGFEMADLDEEQILRTADEGLRRRGYRFSDVKSPAVILEELSLSRGGTILNSAVVLFGKNPARRYAQLRVRLARLGGEREASFLDSRVLEGNALVLVEEIESFLARHIAIASELPKTGVRRSDVPEYPFPALREAMMNALVHRDYAAFDGGVAISVYDDRIEIWSSGGLPEGMTLKELKEERISRPRNPDIAHVFWLRELIERYGIGAGLILEECALAGLPEPEWKLGGSGITLTIRSRRPTGTLVRGALGDLNIRQQDFLGAVKSGDRISVGQYSEKFAAAVSQRQARTDLAQMTAAGWLQRQGRGPSTVYVRTDRET